MEIEALVQKTYDDCHDGVVLITKKKDGYHQARGTGFVIGRAGTSYLIMTCAHCIRYPDTIPAEVQIQVKIPSEKNEYVGEVLYHDNNSDLALVKITDVSKELPVLPFGDTNDAAANTNVIQLGYVMHSSKFPYIYPATTPGKITTPLHRINQRGHTDITDVVCDTNCKKGASGSALLLDHKVIGVLYAMEMRTHINFVRSTETICMIMRSWLQKPDNVQTLDEMIKEIVQKLAVGHQDV